MQFKDWLILQEHAGAPGAKQALFPMGYGGIGLYPAADVITWASDALVYMPEQLRSLKFNWGDGMLANPFRSDSLYNRIENKVATQIQAGSLKTDGKAFEKFKDYANKTTLQVFSTGGLKIDDDGFAKTDYIKPNKSRPGELNDYKYLGTFSSTLGASTALRTKE